MRIVHHLRALWSPPPRPPQPEVPYVLELTCSADGRNHLCTDEALAAAARNGEGAYRALCGHQVVVASLASAPGVLCGDCSARPHRFTRAGQ